MASFSTGSNWSFPDDVPGGWVKVDPNEVNTKPSEPQTKQEPSSEDDTLPQQPRRRHYPPRQCRICLEVVLPTFPPSSQPTDPPIYSSPEGEGGRLLRPCKCKGTQQYVHTDCLRAWRFADPLQKRNYWQCPTCSYKYRLERLRWSSWISSTAAQVGLTVGILVAAMFVLGFVADPIINAYLDPVDTIRTGGGPVNSLGEKATWTEHFIKGLASLGLLGFAKFLLTLSPWHWFNMRGTGVGFGGGGRGGYRTGTGRERLNQLSWIAVVVGIVTFLFAVWKGVRAWAKRTLERAGEKVMDVPTGPNEDEDEEGDTHEDEPATAGEGR